MPKLATIAKAITAAAVAFLTSLISVITDNESLSSIPAKNWLVAVLAALIAGAAVYGVPNRAP